MTDPPIPAATLVIFREREGAPPELLMVERSERLAFAGGALVFPGGRVDQGDELLAATLPGDVEETAARIAAVRETVEEAGLAVGLDLAAGALPPLRAALHAGEPIGAALASVGGRLRLDALVPFARWLPAHRIARTFDTRFYLARLPEGAAPASVDRTENTRLLWASARDVLAEANAGRARIIFPTRRNLERLALYASFAEAAADAARYPIRTITPWEEERGGVPHLCIPDDLGYPVTAEPLRAALRG